MASTATPTSGFSIQLPVNEPTQDHSPTSRLSPESAIRLRAALKQWVDDPASDDADLGDALHAVAREARERGVRAEELLVTLKTTWFEVGGAPNAPHASPSSHKRLDELVTACIKAYYE
jgi:hypothetical protein